MSVKLTCQKHPRYTAKLGPKANCPECIALYMIAVQAQAARLKVN